MGDFFGGETTTQTGSTQHDIRQLPGYEESDAARGTWWDMLKQWGSQPGFGAIAPNWDDIWGTASKRVKDFYQGGLKGPGAIAKTKSNLAKRGVSEQPFAEQSLDRLSMFQGEELQDLAIQQAIQEAQFGEKGRGNWLSSIQSLAGMKPSFMNYGTTSESTSETSGGEGWDLLGQGLGMASSMMMPGGMGGMGQLMKMFGGGAGGGGSLAPSGIGKLAGSMGDSSVPSWMQPYL